MSHHIIVVDDERGVRSLVRRWLEMDGNTVSSYGSGEQCLEALETMIPSLIFLDVHMNGIDGVETLRRIKKQHPCANVIMLTSDVELETAVTAMRVGASNYLTKPLRRDEFMNAVREALSSPAPGEEETPHSSGLIGSSPAMRVLVREIDRVADSNVTVLIHGESGTGKELVARALHDGSKRSEGPFVEVNCAAIPETLQDTELFGHEKGAFTDAGQQRIGRFEQAHNGTLFLDEVAELSLSLQAKLLRAIQEHRFHRVGGTEEVYSDFRLVAASHRDLAAEVEAGRFRADLFYRIAVYELEVEPLRARIEDIGALSRHFLKEFAEGAVPQLSESALALLQRYPWPGNVRELANAIRRAIVLADGPSVCPEHLPPRIQRGEALGGGAVLLPTPITPSGSERMTLEEIERRAISDALARSDGNISEVGRQLGIGRTSLYRKMAKYGLR